MSVFLPPPGYHRIKVVQSFAELVASPFAEGVNAFCWPRELPGDFGAVVEQLPAGEEITTLSDDWLAGLQLNEAGRAARAILLEDQRRLRARRLAPVLDAIQAYPRDDAEAVVRTDVYSFHADSAPVPTETWLCTYHGRPSEGLRNDEAQRWVDLPATRTQLRQLYGGEDDEEFRAFLQESSYDLHYAPAPHAQPFSFGIGNLWRIAVEHSGSLVPPCLHRAPETAPGEPPRLLLIS